MQNPQDTNTKTTRPGYWLRAIEHGKRRMTREYRRTLGSVAREGISDEDYATTMATLEKMARNLGWDETHSETHSETHRGHRGHFGMRRHRGGHHGAI